MRCRARNASVTNVDHIAFMSSERVVVRAYSGYRAEEIPRSFVLCNETIEAGEILYGWIEEDPETRKRKRFFRIRGSDGYLHKLYYDEAEEAWFLSMAG